MSIVSKKPHRIGWTKQASREQIIERFNTEFYNKAEAAIKKRLGDNYSVLSRANFLETKEGVSLWADIKIQVLEDWEKKGRKISFLMPEGWQTLLNQKHFGK